MPGAYELQLIGRYFGSGRIRLARGLLAGTKATGTHGAGSDGHHCHLHINYPKKAPARTMSDDELMQVLFCKLGAKPFHGPEHQGATDSLQGHQQ